MLRFRLSSFQTVMWALLGGFALVSCSYEDVEVKELRQLKIEELDRDGISLTAILWVENPNNYRIKVLGTDADLYLSGTHAGAARLLNNITVPRNYKGTVEASIRTDFDKGSLAMLPVIISAGLRRKVDLRAAGTLRARSFVIGHTFDFDYKHEAKF